MFLWTAWNLAGPVQHENASRSCEGHGASSCGQGEAGGEPLRKDASGSCLGCTCACAHCLLGGGFSCGEASTRGGQPSLNPHSNRQFRTLRNLLLFFLRHSWCTRQSGSMPKSCKTRRDFGRAERSLRHRAFRVEPCPRRPSPTDMLLVGRYSDILTRFLGNFS